MTHKTNVKVAVRIGNVTKKKLVPCISYSKEEWAQKEKKEWENVSVD